MFISAVPPTQAAAFMISFSYF